VVSPKDSHKVDVRVPIESTQTQGWAGKRRGDCVVVLRIGLRKSGFHINSANAYKDCGRVTAKFAKKTTSPLSAGGVTRRGREGEKENR